MLNNLWHFVVMFCIKCFFLQRRLVQQQVAIDVNNKSDTHKQKLENYTIILKQSDI